jgi:hypothetical protein
VLADALHRHRDFDKLKYTVLSPTASSPLTFAYDVTTDILSVRSKVQKMSKTEATGEPVQLRLDELEEEEEEGAQELKRQCI